MGLLTLEAIGSKGEALTDEVAKQEDIAVGFDPEFNCATFDSDAHTDEELEALIFEALDGLDPDWRSQLRIAE